MSQRITAPPRLTERLLSWSLPEELKDPVLGDLEEEFLQRLTDNPAKAVSWYQRQAIRSAWQFIRKTKRGLIMFVLSLLIFIGFTVMAMVLAGSFTMFVDVPSALIVFPGALAFTIAATSWQDFKTAFRHLFTEGDTETTLELKVSERIFNILGNVSLWLGGAMTVIGWVAIGSNLDDVSFFGVAFAVSILTFLYALLVKIVCYVSEQKLRFKRLKMED